MGGYQTPTHSGASRYSERSPSVEASVEDDSKVYHKRRSPVARSKFGVGNEDDACDGASDAVDSHDAGPTHNANTNVTTSDPEHAHHGHGAPCTGSPGASTPSGTPERFVTPPTHPSQLVTDTCQTVSPESLKRKRETASSAASSNKSPKIEIPRNIREHNKLHQKATSYKPQTTLGPNRYWIGILNPDMPIKQVRKQHDLIWIKGNGVGLPSPPLYDEP